MSRTPRTRANEGPFLTRGVTFGFRVSIAAGLWCAVVSAVFLLGIAAFGSGVAYGHMGQGNAVPSNAGGDPKVTHPGWSDDYCTFSPDQVPGILDFRHACVHHDGCYAGFPDASGQPHYWAGKRQCDDWFLGDMQASCADQHASRWGWRYDRCMESARSYYRTVVDYGYGYKGP